MATALQNFVEDAPLERARAIARGLPARLVRDLVADPAVTIADVARIVGPRRTIDRRLKDNTPLSPDESDRFARFVTVLDLASGIFGSRAAAMGRSEEHTSELQPIMRSSYAVFCLKKTTTQTVSHNTDYSNTTEH